jgi:hypothetical protein
MQDVSNIASRQNYSQPQRKNSTANKPTNRKAKDDARDLLEKLFREVCVGGMYGNLRLEISVENGIIQIESLKGFAEKRIR